MRPNQRPHFRSYAANTTDTGGTLSASQIQSMIDDRMQQLFLMSGSPSIAGPPSDLGFAMTMSGTSGRKILHGFFFSGASYHMIHDSSLLQNCHSPSAI